MPEQSSLFSEYVKITPLFAALTVLHTGDKLGGHSRLIVEKIASDNTLFVGSYDFSAEELPTESSLPSRFSFWEKITNIFYVNPKGFIKTIRCMENDHYDQAIKNFVRFPHRTESVPIENIEAMLTSIYCDEKVIDNYLKDCLDEDQNVARFLFHAKKTRFSDGRIVLCFEEALYQEYKDIIENNFTDLVNINNGSYIITMPQKQYYQLRNNFCYDVARVKASIAGGAKQLQYQFLSSKHPLSKPEEGINCSEWCLEKLHIANVLKEPSFNLFKPKTII